MQDTRNTKLEMTPYLKLWNGTIIAYISEHIFFLKLRKVTLVCWMPFLTQPQKDFCLFLESFVGECVNNYT